MSLAILKEALLKEKPLFGTNQTLKNLKKGKTKTIFLAADCNEETKKTILYYSTITKTDIHHLTQKSHELSHICKKNFPISVISY